MKLTLKLDRVADAAYVRVLPGHAVATTRELDAQRIADYDRSNELVGIEFLGVSQGVDLRDLPFGQELARLFEDHDIPQLV